MKLLYGDKVKVIDGFYKGLEGIVSDFDSAKPGYYIEMECLLYGCFVKTPRAWILENYLEKIEGAKS